MQQGGPGAALWKQPIWRKVYLANELGIGQGARFRDI
jgi:hypothetical protein